MGRGGLGLRHTAEGEQHGLWDQVPASSAILGMWLHLSMPQFLASARSLLRVIETVKR